MYEKKLSVMTLIENLLLWVNVDNLLLWVNETTILMPKEFTVTLKERHFIQYGSLMDYPYLFLTFQKNCG